MKKSLPLVLATALAAPLVSLAQTPPASLTREHFEQIDVNKDGSVTKSEYSTFMEGAFTRLDADGNGWISAVEAAKVMSPEQFATLDINGNGQVSRQEFMQKVLEEFDRHDTDRDGRLTGFYPESK